MVSSVNVSIISSGSATPVASITQTSISSLSFNSSIALIKEPFKVEEGYVKVPTKPGLGIELDEDAMQDKLGHDWRNPEPYDSRDGSVVDW